MTEPVNIYDAKSRLSQLVERAENGEEIIIARNGRPVARLVGLRRSVSRRAGRLKGKIRMAANFDDPLPPDLFGGETE